MSNKDTNTFKITKNVFPCGIIQNRLRGGAGSARPIKNGIKLTYTIGQFVFSITGNDEVFQVILSKMNMTEREFTLHFKDRYFIAENVVYYLKQMGAVAELSSLGSTLTLDEMGDGADDLNSFSFNSHITFVDLDKLLSGLTSNAAIILASRLPIAKYISMQKGGTGFDIPYHTLCYPKSFLNITENKG